MFASTSSTYKRVLPLQNYLKGMRSITVFLLLILSTASLVAQPNLVDDQGRKQGEWRKKYEGKNQLRFKGQFVDDVPVGEFMYFHENGARMAVITYRGETGVGYAKMFESNGRIMAEGLFVDEKRDSTWRYYSPQGDLVTETQWQNGERHGVEKTYFPTGRVAEVVNWMHGVMEGPRTVYFAHGERESVVRYQNDERHGEAVYFDLDGDMRMAGDFNRGEKIGTWTYYEDGRPKYTEEWFEGRVVGTECLVADCPELEDEEEVETPEDATEGEE